MKYLLALLCLLPIIATAQPLDKIKTPEELTKVITSLDAALFNAYNTCDLPKFAAFFTDDIEFYHDQGGITLGKEKLTESIKNNICGKVTRELLAGSRQVHPMNGIGAIDMGTHLFHHPGKDDTEPLGEGKFIHLWRYRDGAWKVARIYSYDHKTHKPRL